MSANWQDRSEKGATSASPAVTATRDQSPRRVALNHLCLVLALGAGILLLLVLSTRS